MLTGISLTSSDEPADVRDDSKRCGGPGGLRSASHSDGRMGGHRFRPDSKHTTMEVSLSSSQLVGTSKRRGDSTNYTLCFSAPHCDEVKKKLVPISITDQPSEHETCISLFFFFFLFPLSVSLSLYCVSELGVIQDYSLALSACHMVLFLIMTFIFLFWKREKKKKGNYNYKEITAPEKNDIDISGKLQDQLHELLLYHCIIIRL